MHAVRISLAITGTNTVICFSSSTVSMTVRQTVRISLVVTGTQTVMVCSSSTVWVRGTWTHTSLVSMTVWQRVTGQLSSTYVMHFFIRGWQQLVLHPVEHPVLQLFWPQH